MKMRWFALFLAGLAVFGLVGEASAAIVNINARSNAAANPVEFYLEAGTYSVIPIGIADGGAYDAWNAWSRTTCTEPGGCIRTVPTTVTGWVNDFVVSSPDIEYVEVNGVELPPVDTPPTSSPGSVLSSYFLDGKYYFVDDGMVYPSAPDALAGAQSSLFRLAAPGYVGFYIPDYDNQLFDNSGGISLSINSPVPIPGAAWLFGTGLIGLIGLGRKPKP